MDESESMRRVHEAYWTSTRGVNRIADDLGVSKGRLYELIQPLATDTPCPLGCGAMLAYPNRTARDRGETICPTCVLERSEGGRAPAPKPESTAPKSESAAPRPEPALARPEPPRASPRDAIPRPFKRSTVRTVTILLASAVGAAAGYLVGRAMGPTHRGH